MISKRQKAQGQSGTFLIITRVQHNLDIFGWEQLRHHILPLNIQANVLINNGTWRAVHLLGILYIDYYRPNTP